MSEQKIVDDQQARSRALDPSQSFIVQAPAGSGKTGLLVQRFLVLLAGIDAPEEIIAITFTRKAAAEMHQRIFQALEWGGGNAPPVKDHEKRTWELARRVLARDRERGWQLLDNPARLRIQTIDSLCASLVRQMPILSTFGAAPVIAEDAGPLYLDAARNTIAEVESGAQWSDAVAHLIEHMDNRLDKLRMLISFMLARRDQWLRLVADPDHPQLARKNLEVAMARLIADALRDLGEHIPWASGPELVELARFAGNNLKDKASPIAVCGDLQSLPGLQAVDHPRWQGLAALLLTADGSWRKRWTKNEGFPASSGTGNQEDKAYLAEMKQRMSAFIETLQGQEVFRERLAILQDLPPHQYTNGEWQVLQALIELLRLAAGHLELIFTERGQVDFPALVQAAIAALGGPESPTDLALALDYRIRHILVDEFQDTSFNQYELLQRLTAGWQPADGHTLFVVGDPMQSIYRFREAEVGLFLAARDYGVGQVPVESLRLCINFRSQRGIVDWINRSFPKVLPARDSIAEGAVSYVPFTFCQPKLESSAVSIYPSLQRDDAAEARQVLSIVQQAKTEYPAGTTAILVRSRSHLAQIVAQLQKARLRFQAVEIERLAHRPVVQDLLALTRALSHIGDRIAWLAVLRAPYCGLSLEDLYTLAGRNSAASIIDLLRQEPRLEQLSEDGRHRMSRVLPVLVAASAAQSRGSLRGNVEGAWIALGGPACVSDAADLGDGEVYFQLLEKLGEQGDVPDVHELNLKVGQLFALPDVEADDFLQLMTVHRAKGLEFDTVIMPGLGRSPRHDGEKLLYWLQRSKASGKSDLLLAPVSAQGDDKNPMARYLQRLENARGCFEDGRVLYVAATRARQRLHLLGHVGVREREGKIALENPPRDSLLARLWPVVKEDFQYFLASQEADVSYKKDSAESRVCSTARTRLALDWSMPAPPEHVQFAGCSVQRTVGELVEFDWAGETVRQVGVVVHRLLQHIGKIGIENVAEGDLRRFNRIGRHMLARSAVPREHLEDAVDKTHSALRATLEDDRGRWVLSGLHEKARCELALSVVWDGGIDHMVIDRTFLDEQGTRWIIDYKTGIHAGSDVEVFLDREQERFRGQLERYAIAMHRIEERPIRLGLYFPILRGWREWSY